jgi:CheY-like chemotaxis protein
MLVDDDIIGNFFHRRIIKKNNLETIVLMKNSGVEALEYLKSKKNTNDILPDLIFLDIDMPGMNGWEFLYEYDLLDKELQSQAIIIMLTKSANSKDIARIKSWNFVSDYIIKPLTNERLEEIIHKHFKLLLQ